MANYEATRYDINAANLTGIEGVNTGIVIPWSSASIPSGFLECNGQSVSTSTYANLFAVIAYTYGGSGASFNVPDLTDRTVVNKSNNKALATTGGANTVTPTGNVGGSLGNTTLTSATIPSHLHSGTASASNGRVDGDDGPTQLLGNAPAANTSSTGGGGAHTHNVSGAFTGSANSVLQPYLTLIYIIKT
jgi:microcystin-dependent protein